MSLFLAITVWQRIAMPRGGETISKLHTTTWFWLAALTALLLTGCATEPADAQPAAAPSLVVETVAPAEDVHATVTPEPPGDALAVPADDALPEGPVRLVALDVRRGAETAVLTPEQLADSASTFAQFTGLEGLTASQPELREGDPDFLARTIVFVNSQGELVGMVVATSETAQIYIWRDANGDILCQPTDQTQPLESEACDAAIAEYWHPTLAAQEQATAEQATEAAEAEQSPHAIHTVTLHSFEQVYAPHTDEAPNPLNKLKKWTLDNEYMRVHHPEVTPGGAAAELVIGHGDQQHTVLASLSAAAHESYQELTSQTPWLLAIQSALEEGKLTLREGDVVVVDDTRIWFIQTRIHKEGFAAYLDIETGEVRRFSIGAMRDLLDRKEVILTEFHWFTVNQMMWDPTRNEGAGGMVVTNRFGIEHEFAEGEWQLMLPHRLEGGRGERFTQETIINRVVGPDLCKNIGCEVPFDQLQLVTTTYAGVPALDYVSPATSQVVFTAMVDPEGKPMLPLLQRYINPNVKAGDGGARSDSERAYEQNIINGHQPLDRTFVQQFIDEVTVMDQVSPDLNRLRWEVGRVAQVGNRIDLTVGHLTSSALIFERKHPYHPLGYSSIDINPVNWRDQSDFDRRRYMWTIVLAEYLETVGAKYVEANTVPPIEGSGTSQMSYTLPASEYERFFAGERERFKLMMGNAAQLTLDFFIRHEVTLVARFGKGGFDQMVHHMNAVIRDNR